jgi:hypothetical protein
MSALGLERRTRELTRLMVARVRRALCVLLPVNASPERVAGPDGLKGTPDRAQLFQLRTIFSENCFPPFPIAATSRDEGAPSQEIFYAIC